ncbi:MAG: FAD-dependent oxidoreductase [Bacteroidales bacterium]
MRIRTMIYLFVALALISCGKSAEKYDVVVIGGGASGVAAGIQAARSGAKTLIVEENLWLGGMLTSAGVSATDGCYKLRGGIWDEFRTALEKHYGGAGALMTGWVSYIQFEPSVGDSIFKAMCAAEKNLTIRYSARLTQAERSGEEWHLTITEPDPSVTSSESSFVSASLKAKVLIDGTELGDVAKMLNVPYNIGMDARADTGEDIAPEQANDIVQDLTYVAILKDYGRDVTIPRPEGYDSTKFFNCCTNPLNVNPKKEYSLWDKNKMSTYGKLPNGKYMINWPLAGNDYYVNLIDLDSTGRARAIEKAKNQTLSFVYFMQTSLGLNTLGLADDEYPTADKLPFIPYHRESRRIDGLVRFNLNDLSAPYDQPHPLYRTAIAVGDYPIDHHHNHYNGELPLPDLHFRPVPSYGLPMGVMIPKTTKNLIVAEKSISVTNLVNGSTRLQPVVLELGQAAGALAALAVKSHKDVSEVPVRAVQNEILEAGAYLLPYLDRTNTDPHFKAMQRIGATGILAEEEITATGRIKLGLTQTPQCPEPLSPSA